MPGWQGEIFEVTGSKAVVLPMGLLAVGGAGMFMSGSTGMARSPFLLHMAGDLNVDIVVLSHMLAGSSVAVGISSFFTGPLAVRLGRRGLLVGALVIMAAAMAGSAAAWAYWQVLVAALLGGLASGIYADQVTQVYLNGEVFEEGGVAVSVGGDVKLSGVISQGCTPIGETWTLTHVEQNLIHQIANRPAYAVLSETVQQLSPADQQKARGNLFIGLVMNEYLEDFHRGDFLVRNLIGGDPNSGVLAVAALPRAGQTIQFQRRDAVAANEDMGELLGRAKEKIGGSTIYGGCLCCCNGRGKNLFGQPHHDAELVQKEFGPMGLVGFYGNGEIGPVGEKNYLHGFTASLALFVKK